MNTNHLECSHVLHDYMITHWDRSDSTLYLLHIHPCTEAGPHLGHSPAWLSSEPGDKINHVGILTFRSRINPRRNEAWLSAPQAAYWLHIYEKSVLTSGRRNQKSVSPDSQKGWPWWQKTLPEATQPRMGFPWDSQSLEEKKHKQRHT